MYPSLKTVAGITLVLISLFVILMLSVTSSPTPEPADTETFGERWWMDNIPEPVETAEGKPTVSYIPEGFRPKRMTIKEGDTVRFVNFSPLEMQLVAEEPENLPEFDQEQPEKEYKHTFEEPGEWQYHNKIRPEDSGYIVVRERFDDDQETTTNPETEVDFTTISSGTGGGAKQPSRSVVTGPEDWEELRGSFQHSQELPEDPEIDWEEEMIIAVFMGEQRTGGYRIEIDELTQTNGELSVQIKRSEPEPGQPVTQALTYPYHIIKTEAVSQVTFDE